MHREAGTNGSIRRQPVERMKFTIIRLKESSILKILILKIVIDSDLIGIAVRRPGRSIQSVRRETRFF